MITITKGIIKSTFLEIEITRFPHPDNFGENSIELEDHIIKMLNPS